MYLYMEYMYECMQLGIAASFLYKIDDAIYSTRSIIINHDYIWYQYQQMV